MRELITEYAGLSLPAILAVYIVLVPVICIRAISASPDSASSERTIPPLSNGLVVVVLLGWGTLSLVGPPVLLHDRLGVWTPFVLLWLLADLARFDMEPGPIDERFGGKGEQAAPFFGQVILMYAPAAIPAFAIVGLLEYGLRAGVSAVVPMAELLPSSSPLEGALWLVAGLAGLPVLVLVVDSVGRRLSDSWLESRPDPIVWAATIPGVLRLLFACSFVLVPGVLFVTVGTYSPIVVAFFGIGPIVLATDLCRLERRCLKFTLFVPAAVLAALLEYELARVLGG